jgi:hypothetical protein
MDFARQWTQAKSPEEKSDRYADAFEQVVACGQGRTSRITDRAELIRYWGQILQRRNPSLNLYHVVFDGKGGRLAVVYAQAGTLLPPQEADLIELDGCGRVARSEVLDGCRLVALGLGKRFPGGPF